MLGAVFPQVLDMTRIGSLVILLVLIVRFFLKKAPKIFSYALWAVVLFRLLCPVSIPSPVSVMPELESIAQSYTLAEADIPPAGVGVAVYHAIGDAWNGGLGVQDIPISGQNDIDGGAYVSSMWWEVWVLLGQYVWLAGVVCLAGYSLFSLIRLRKRLVGAIPLRDNLYLADHIDTPFVMGLVHPKIYLPSSLSPREQTYIILHEQCHIRRLDHLVKLLSFVALCIHWFNPLVWAAFLLAGKDMEMSCDEAVMGRLGEDIRADYSASLLSLSTGRPIIAGLPLAFGEGDTKSRIQNILRWKRPRFWVAALAACVCIGVIAACAADPQGGTGQYRSMEDFAHQAMADQEGALTTYFTAEGPEAQTRVTGTRLDRLEKRGEVEGLAPEGTLEAWFFHYLVQVEAEDILLAGGMYEEDGWYDLEGQGGYDVVSLRYPDGSYDVLYQGVVNDGMNFYGYHNSYEEAIYDWYVADQGLDLPLYVEDWTDRIGTPAEGLGNFPVHRCDGPGWYFYLPVTAWTQQGTLLSSPEEGWIWTSAYGTGSALTVRYLSGGPREGTQQEDSGGRHRWTVFHPAGEGDSWKVTIQWSDANLTASVYTAMEAEMLQAMAESFTLDHRISGDSSGGARLAATLNGIREGDALTLELTRDGQTAGRYEDCWLAINSTFSCNQLKEIRWVPAAEIAAPEGDSVTLSQDSGWSLTAYAGERAVRCSGPAGTWWLRPDAETPSPYGELRSWLDELEYSVLENTYSLDLVIPDTGQNYLEAAAAYAEAVEGLHLRATPGSKFCYTFVSTQVEAAEEATAFLRAEQEIGSNAYAFWLTTVFVPENELALSWSMAGNTGGYTGEDPSVPENALEQSLCGWIAREGDGWHGRIVGTGW